MERCGKAGKPVPCCCSGGWGRGRTGESASGSGGVGEAQGEIKHPWFSCRRPSAQTPVISLGAPPHPRSRQGCPSLLPLPSSVGVALLDTSVAVLSVRAEQGSPGNRGAQVRGHTQCKFPPKKELPWQLALPDCPPVTLHQLQQDAQRTGVHEAQLGLGDKMARHSAGWATLPVEAKECPHAASAEFPSHPART